MEGQPMTEKEERATALTCPACGGKYWDWPTGGDDRMVCADCGTLEPIEEMEQ